MCCGSWGRKESDMTERLNWTDLIRIFMNYIFQHTFKHKSQNLSFLDVSVVKNPTANAGDTGLFPESGRSAGERNGDPLQYSCLGNP